MRIFFACVLFAIIFAATGCDVAKKDITDSLLKNQNFTDVNNITIAIPGVKKDYKIAIINDLHVILSNDEILPEEDANVNARINLFTNAVGLTSREAFENLIDIINGSDADAVLFGGDLIDFYSQANREFIEAGLAKLQKPYIYIGADHDFSGYYTKAAGISPEIATEIQENPVYSLDLGDVILLGINNSTSQLSNDAEKEINKILSAGKPVIILTHVPFEPVTDKGLGEESEAAWGNRKLFWGENGYYVPNDTTKEIMDSIYNSHNVKCVVAGHMHFRYNGMLTDNIPQYITDAAYTGIPTVLTITGKE